MTCKLHLCNLSNNLIQLCSVNSDQEWQLFMRQFADSIRHIVHDVDKVISNNGHIEDELESLRSKVDELTEEVNLSFSR